VDKNTKGSVQRHGERGARRPPPVGAGVETDANGEND